MEQHEYEVGQIYENIYQGRVMVLALVECYFNAVTCRVIMDDGTVLVGDLYHGEWRKVS